MADPNAYISGGSPIGDFLTGLGGSPINRGGLNAAVVQGQAMAGLRTAQTEEALGKAAQAREEAAASENLETTLRGMKNPDGTQMIPESHIPFVANQMRFLHGGALPAFQAINEAIKNNNTITLTNPASTPEQRTRADQALNPNANPYQAVEGQLVPRMQENVDKPTVFQTPGSIASEAQKNASAQHLGQQNGNIPPEASGPIAELIRNNPNLAPNLRSLTSNGGWRVAYQLARPNGPLQGEKDPLQIYGKETPPPGSAPANGAPPPAPGAANAGHPAYDPSQSPGAGGPNQGAVGTGFAPAPGVSLKEQADIRSDFSKGTGAKQATSLNTMYEHSLLFDMLANEMGNGNFKPTNAINVMWKRMFGSAAPGNLQIAAEFLGREAVRATVNSGAGTGEERELKVGLDASPDALHGAASTLRSLAGSQLHSLDFRARRGGVDISQLISPEAAAAYHLGKPLGAVLNPTPTGGPGATPPAPGAANPLDAIRAAAEAENTRRLRERGGQPGVTP